MLSHDFFINNTEVFYRYYKLTLAKTGFKPNAAHNALAKLEALGKLSSVITQNVDGLHQMAGSKCVYELHGSIYRNYCMNATDSMISDIYIHQMACRYANAAE